MIQLLNIDEKFFKKLGFMAKEFVSIWGNIQI